jgi:hypothetical protein
MTRVAWYAGAYVLAAAPALLGAPAPERDPVLIGSKWKGKLTQRGTFATGGTGPPEFKIVLTITDRDRNSFEAELREVAEAQSLSITYLVKGEISRDKDGKGYIIKFKSVAAKDIENTYPLLGIPYEAALTGRTMKGTWKIPRNKDGIEIEGDFEVELLKK